MRAKVAAVVIISVLVVSGAFRALLAQQALSIWDGVYTEEQAKRGEPLYTATCASCHGPDLSGGEMAPGLTGGEFRSDWDGLSVGDLFERTRVSMPQNTREV
jgi:mono/diheme cytochrome c family protein